MTNENPRGLPVAWLDENDCAWETEGQAARFSDNRPRALVLALATDYAALQADLAAAIARADELEAKDKRGGAALENAINAVIGLQARAEAAEETARERFLRAREWAELSGKNEARAEAAEAALDHIARVGKASRKQTQRTQWIVARAISALNGDDEWMSAMKPKGYHDALERAAIAAREGRE